MPVRARASRFGLRRAGVERERPLDEVRGFGYRRGPRPKTRKPSLLPRPLRLLGPCPSFLLPPDAARSKRHQTPNALMPLLLPPKRWTLSFEEAREEGRKPDSGTAGFSSSGDVGEHGTLLRVYQSPGKVSSNLLGGFLAPQSPCTLRHQDPATILGPQTWDPTLPHWHFYLFFLPFPLSKEIDLSVRRFFTYRSHKSF